MCCATAKFGWARRARRWFRGTAERGDPRSRRTWPGWLARRSGIVIDRLLGAWRRDPLSGAVARAQEHPLVCGVEVGSDLGKVGRAELVDDRLDIAAFVQVVADVELLDGAN
jgi:hypothetical protein